MVFIILATLIYAALTAVSTTFLTSLSVPLFFVILYLLPIGINLTFTKLQKNKNKLLFSLLLPTLSIIFYVAFAYITSSSGVWTEFIEMNTLSEGNMSVDIADNLFTTGQMSFAAMTYYVPSAATYVLTKITKK